MTMRSLWVLLAAIPYIGVQGTEGAMRSMKYTSRSAEAARAWQREVRGRLLPLLKLDDLVAARGRIALEPRVVSSEKKGGYVVQEVEIASTPGRRIVALVTTPAEREGRLPAVVCIHGHGGDTTSVHDKRSAYKGFAAELAARGYVTAAVNVGQHRVEEQGRTLMGERLWDLMRCVDYLASRDDVHAGRIGCAGLSLGGEMAMWLGGMDERVAATVSCAFLTRMDQMERNHCMCWKFDGLRELVDFADVYALAAPRPLLCQNGMKEPASQFPPSIARDAMAEVSAAYRDLGTPAGAVLHVHEGGHEVDLPSLIEFLDRHLRRGRRPNAHPPQP